MRLKKGSAIFTESEEKIWKAWRPMMFFPVDRETLTYLELRTQVSKLTCRGCDLACLLSSSSDYATFRLLEHLRRTSRSCRTLSRSEKISRYLAATGDESARLAENLARILERRQAEMMRLKLADLDGAFCFVVSSGLVAILRQYGKVIHQAQHTNNAGELRTWRRDQLEQLVNHVKNKGVKHFWQPLAALVSCCQPRDVAIEYIDEPPYFNLCQDPRPLRRSPSQLRQEYFNILRSQSTTQPHSD